MSDVINGGLWSQWSHCGTILERSKISCLNISFPVVKFALSVSMNSMIVLTFFCFFKLNFFELR